ncbi:MAG: rhamnulokinase family protein [Mycobacteriales bacterium]
MTRANLAAVDLGASSGRVMLGRVGDGVLEIEEVNRFANEPIQRDLLRWDVQRLYRGILDGLSVAGRRADGLDSVGIDSWAVDYGLLDDAGQLIDDPVHYRDDRTLSARQRVAALVTNDELYAITGLQQLPFNTVYQLMADLETGALSRAATMLMVPDLIAYWLTGEIGAEVTNASTTQLYDVRERTWSTSLIERLGLPLSMFPPLREPGSPAGRLLPAVLDQTGLSAQVRVTAVGSHDTASAVVGVPADGERFAYISCGTWSLVGVELQTPVLTAASQAANFTNEAGVDGTTRYLRNVMGLWLLQQCIRVWRSAGQLVELPELLREAAELPALAAVVDADDPAFLPFGDMPGRIAAACAATGQRAPETPAAVVRCVVDSLALAYRKAVRTACELSGHQVEVVHIVGGGVRNELLCQLTADACGIPVLAGPVEAAAIGNMLVQARTAGALSGGLDVLRALTRDTQPVQRYEPRGDQSVWQAAQARIAGR